MEESLSSFHKNKHYAFGDQRDQFNFPKLHSLVHYTSAIRSLGTLDGYNTELPERLHINFAKKAYNASNKRDYIIQMTVWLQRQEAVHRMRSYLAWVRPQKETPSNADADSDGEALDREDIHESKDRAQGASRFKTVKTPHFRHLSATPSQHTFMLQSSFALYTNSSLRILPHAHSRLHTSQIVLMFSRLLWFALILFPSNPPFFRTHPCFPFP